MLCPPALQDKLNQGKVVIDNWQSLSWDSAEDPAKKKSVDKRGPKSDEAYARQVLRLQNKQIVTLKALQSTINGLNSS
jgi:hypothetical protein